MQQPLFRGFLGLIVRRRGALGASLVGIAELVQYLPDPLTGVLLPVGIEDAPLKNPGIRTILAVSMLPWASVPERVVYVLKHFLADRTRATAFVIRRRLQALLVPSIHVSPDRDARTSKPLGCGLRFRVA